MTTGPLWMASCWRTEEKNIGIPRSMRDALVTPIWKAHKIIKDTGQVVHTHSVENDGGALNHKMPISKRVSSHRESEWWGMLTYKHLHSGFPSISHHSILWEIYHWLHCAELKNRINQADRFGRTGFICWVNLEFMLNLRRVFKRNPNKITLLGHFSLYSFNWH